MLLAFEAPDWDAQTWATVIQGAAVAFALPFVFVELRNQKRELLAQSEALGFQTYQAIADAYSTLMIELTSTAVADDIWTTNLARHEELSEAQDVRRSVCPSSTDPLRNHGAWRAMTNGEKVGYRYTRSALEIFERAYKAHELEIIDEELWTKWTRLFEYWTVSKYFTFVLEDHDVRFLPGFVELAHLVRNQQIAGWSSAEAGSADG